MSRTDVHVTILMRPDHAPRDRKWEPYDETLDAGLHQVVFRGTLPDVFDRYDHDFLLSVVEGACNSYPDEMFTGSATRPFVKAYRDAGCRSLAVGDIVVLDVQTFGPDHGMTFEHEEAYSAHRVGFVPMPAAWVVPDEVVA